MLCVLIVEGMSVVVNGCGGCCDCDVCVYAESVRVAAVLMWGMDEVWLW